MMKIQKTLTVYFRDIRLKLFFFFSSLYYPNFLNIELVVTIKEIQNLIF